LPTAVLLLGLLLPIKAAATHQHLRHVSYRCCCCAGQFSQYLLLLLLLLGLLLLLSTATVGSAPVRQTSAGGTRE